MINSFEHTKKVFINRYNFIYKNACFLLAEIQAEHFDQFEALSLDIKRITGIDGCELGPFNRTSNPDGSTTPYTLQLVEEYLFRDFVSSKSELEIYIENMYAYPCSIVEDLKREYILEDSLVGPNKKDIAMQVLLELIRSFIWNQDTNTNVKERSRDNRLVYLCADSSLCSFEKRHKQNAVEEYLRLVKYKNTGFGRKNDVLLLPNYHLPGICNMSLVSSNSFLKNVCKLEGKLSFDNIREVYFNNHCEIPWNTKAKCEENKDDVKRDERSKCCGFEFYISDDSVFALNGYILQVCPKCGYLVNVSDKVEAKVKRCIEHRDFYDKDVLRKREILSELIKLEGIDTIKVLVKSRKNKKGGK